MPHPEGERRQKGRRRLPRLPAGPAVRALSTDLLPGRLRRDEDVFPGLAADVPG